MPLSRDAKTPSELAFEGHPYGLVVSDRTGMVIAVNEAATKLLGAEARVVPGGDRPICEVVGCRLPQGPLANVCLHELAVEREDALPEVRVDLPLGAVTRAVWVTAARLSVRPDLVMTELRPGTPEDRRRRTEPHWTAGPRLWITTLGRTRVFGDEGPIEGRWLSNRPGRILKLLVVQRHRTVYTDEIAERLWGENTSASVKALRYFVHVLRTDLEPSRSGRGTSSFILAKPGGYELDTARVQIDADQFERRVADGRAAVGTGDLQLAREHFTAAIALFGGDFLADEPYAEWALDERDRLHNIVADALRQLVALECQAGDLDTAIAMLRRLTGLEPFDTDVHAELLGLLVRRGRRSEAVRRYQALRHRMLSTFGEDLDFSLSDLMGV